MGYGQAAELLVVRDLDVASYRTERAFDDMVHLAVINSIASPESLREARLASEAGGVSFDLIDHLGRQGVPEDQTDELLLEFGANRRGQDYLYYDAHQAHDALVETGTPFVTCTKGGVATQLAKLCSCGWIDYPYMITDTVSKGGLIANAYGSDGLYRLQARVGLDGIPELLVARSVCLVEDNEAAFDGLPAGCSGLNVRRPEGRKSPGQIELPPNVLVARSLAPLTRRLRTSAWEVI